jgi:hypothetical protein
MVIYYFQACVAKLNSRTILAISLIALSIAIGTTTSITNPAFAAKDSAHDGLEKADQNIHENAPQNDVTIHEGMCQGGHSTDTLDTLGGCDGAGSPITDPGESDDHRQDK